MEEGVTVANAFVQIMPSMEGATDNITNAILPSIGSAGDQAGAMFGGKFSGKLGTLMKGAGAAVLGYLAFDTLVDSFAEVESGFNKVIIATGATGDAAKELQDVYTNVAGSVTGSFDDIGAAVGELNTRFGLQGDALEEASEAAMKYAKVNGVDAVTAIQDVSRMMNNAGISADQYSHVLDVMTVAAQQSGIDVGKLANSVTENAASFRQLGFSTEESIAMLAQFEKAGVNSSQVLAGMKKGVAEWAKEGKSAQQGFADFVAGIQDGSITSADAIDLFGSRAGVAMYDAAKQGQLSWDDMFAAISEGSDGALDQVYNDTLTAQEKFDILGKKVQTGFYEIIEPLVDAILPYMDEIIEGIGIGIDWLVNDVAPKVKFVGDVIVNVIDFIKQLVDWFEPFAEAGNKFCDDLYNDFVNLRDGTAQTFGEISTAIETELNDAQTIGSNTVDAFTAAMNGDFDTAAEHAKTAFETMRSSITAKLSAAQTFVVNSADTIGRVLGFPGLGDTVNSVFQSIATFMENPIENAYNYISGIPDAIVGWFYGLGSRITSAIGSIYFPTPHISWTSVDIAGVTSVSLPTIQWYARGGIVDGATLIGAGEAGKEAIVPLTEPNIRPFSEAVASDINGEIRALREEIQNLKLVLNIDGRAFAEATVKDMDKALNDRSNRILAGGIA